MFILPCEKKSWIPRPPPYAVRKKVVGVAWGFGRILTDEA